MTDNEIIKALECCTSDCITCDECPYEYTKHIIGEEFETMPNGKCYDDLSCDEWHKIDLLDLITRQKAEIESLSKLANIGRQAICEHLNRNGIDKKAIKEFAERLKECGTKVEGGKGFEGVFVMANNLQIDNLVKEMVGDE